MSNKKPKKLQKLQLKLLKQQNKNKFNNKENKRYLLITKTHKVVKNLRATVKSILHLKEEKERMTITLIYPLTVLVLIELNLSLQWLQLQQLKFNSKQFNTTLINNKTQEVIHGLMKNNHTLNNKVQLITLLLFTLE